MTTAFERASAPIGTPYIAPLLKQHWFRCDTNSRSGCYRFGYETTGITSTPVQIFADGEWHTVVGYDDTECRPPEPDRWGEYA